MAAVCGAAGLPCQEAIAQPRASAESGRGLLQAKGQNPQIDRAHIKELDEGGRPAGGLPISQTTCQKRH
jgi:hypothetical protein